MAVLERRGFKPGRTISCPRAVLLQRTLHSRDHRTEEQRAEHGNRTALLQLPNLYLEPKCLRYRQTCEQPTSQIQQKQTRTRTQCLANARRTPEIIEQTSTKQSTAKGLRDRSSSTCTLSYHGSRLRHRRTCEQSPSKDKARITRTTTRGSMRTRGGTQTRSEERRGGKECTGRCRARWST